MALAAWYTGTPALNTNLNGISIAEGMARNQVSDAFRQMAADIYNFAASFSGSAPSIQTVTSAATVTPTFTNDQVNITAQAVALALANPSGTAVDSWGMIIRIKDNGLARAITYGTQYRAIGVTLPTTTVAGKTLYLGLDFNIEDSKFDVFSVAQQA